MKNSLCELGGRIVGTTHETTANRSPEAYHIHNQQSIYDSTALHSIHSQKSIISCARVADLGAGTAICDLRNIVRLIVQRISSAPRIIGIICYNTNPHGLLRPRHEHIKTSPIWKAKKVMMTLQICCQQLLMFMMTRRPDPEC